MNPIDLRRVRMHDRKAAQGVSKRQAKPPRPKQREMFLRGPIPLEWLSQAGNLPGRSLHVGVAVWLLAGLKKSRTVPVSNIISLKLGVDRSAKYRALEWLEDANLISVERRIGRAPIVTILETPSDK